MSSPSRQRFEPLRNTLSAPWQAWLVHGLLVFTAAGITEWLTPGRDDVRPQLGRVGQVLLGPLSNWDGAWYLRIAEEGYATRQSTAFFPLYPLLIRWVSELTGVSLRLAGLAISNLAFLGALLLLHRLVRDRYGADIATRATWLLALTPFGFLGTYSYKIPDWADALDIVVVGGGGGGEGGGIAVTGSGGSAASWAYQTVVRGVDIPSDTYYIAGVVGAGGRGGRGVEAFVAGDLFGGIDGEDGQESTAVASGMTTIESAGGTGGKLRATVAGEGLADLDFNGVTYPGCGDELIPGNPGNHPGGGGAGGWPLVGRAGDGSDGQIWIRAYGWSGS